MRSPLSLRCLFAAVAALAAAPAMAESTAWAALDRPGHAALIRHARAPGTGDPAGFTLGDCSTQRNLDDRGREQARALGRRLRAHGIDGRPVYTSHWCRARETAELLGAGPVRELAGLNSFFGDRFTEAEIMPQLRRFLRAGSLDPPPLLVTHQVNITALTGTYAREGEIIVVRVQAGGTTRVVGRIAPP